MYRYVFKRVKETIEFGVNARKSYACQKANSIKNQNERSQQQQQTHTKQVANFQDVNFLTPIEHRQQRYEDFKRKYNFKHPNSCNPFLQAITWSTALVAGFYSAQLLCLYRRNRGLDPKKCLFNRWEKHQLLQKKYTCSSYNKPKSQHQRSFVPSAKFQCPLQKLLARRKASSSSAKTPSQKKNAVIEETDRFGLNHEFATFGLFDKRFDKFYENFGDTSTYKKVNVDVQVHNLSNDLPETLLKSKSDGNNSHSSQNTTTSTQQSDEAIEAMLSNLAQMVGEMEFQLGVDCIIHGHYEDAVDHFRMAASSNHASSLFNLALLYEQGLGVNKDKEIAYKLYKSAGELGHDKALFNQGIFHARGLGGVKKSTRLAKKFFEKSAALGNSDAIEALEMLLPDYRKTSFSSNPDDFIVADHSSNSSLPISMPQYRGSNLRSIAVT